MVYGRIPSKLSVHHSSYLNLNQVEIYKNFKSCTRFEVRFESTTKIPLQSMK